MRRLIARPEAALLCLALGAYAYFYQAGGWNQNSRFDLTRAIVERGTHRIDAYYRNTGDLACQAPGHARCEGWRGRLRPGEHAYCDKSPGVSWLGVPMYGAIYALAGSDRPSPRYLAWSAWATTVFSIGLPAAVGVVALYALLGALGVGRRASAALAVAYALGTLALPYSTLLYGHQPVASLLLCAFALLARARHGVTGVGPVRLAVVGALLGAAVLMEYTAAIGVVALCAYAATFVRPWPRLGWLAAGGAPAAIALAAYHAVVFGGPLTTPYEFSTQKHRHMGGYMGMSWPDGDALWGITFSSYRGLFYAAPWLLAGLVGIALLARRRALRAEAAVCGGLVVAFVWLNASLVDWQGGWAMGPRYLVPCIPFLVIGAAGLVLFWRWGRAWAAWLAAAAVIGYTVFLMVAGTAVKPEVPVTEKRPFSRYLLPRLYAGQVAVSTQSIDSAGAPPTGPRQAWNLGHAAGLDGLGTLAPLGVWTAACAAWLAWAARRPTSAR